MNESSEPKVSPSRHRRWWALAALLVVGVVVGVLAGMAKWSAPHNEPNDGPLDGQLTVLVRPPDRTIEPVPVEQSGAAPVHSGGAMCLDAELNQPAFIYLVWIDSAGQLLPLYPWNNERLEITDINAPPPERRAGKLVFSPLLGRSWTFGDQPGIETVLLLARRTPLPPNPSLESIIGPLVHDKSRLQNGTSGEMARAVGFIKINRVSMKTAAVLDGKELDDSALPGRPSAAALKQLRAHFDVVQVVQFMLQGPTAAAESPLPSAGR